MRDDGDEKQRNCCRPTNLCILLVAILGIVGICLGVTKPWEKDDSSNSQIGDFEFIQCKSDSDYPCCNGLESNCLLRANEVVWAATHNSMSDFDNGFLATYNHFDPLEESLKAGYRVFLLDLCDCGDEEKFGGLVLCHGVCEAGTRDPLVVLTSIRDFLIRNPSEVIMLELQVSEESKENLLSLFYAVMIETGKGGFISLNDFIYEHPSPNDDWPLMKDLIQNNTRLIVFQHNGPDCNVEGNCPRGFLSTFLYMFETSWDLQGADEIKDYETSCALTDRGADASRSNTFFLLNHFANNKLTSLPDSSIAKEINDKSILKSRITACEIQVGHQVNIIAIDFWTLGNTAEVTQLINSENGITLSPTTISTNTSVAQPTPTPAEADGIVVCADCCNGLESNCDLRVNEVVFPMSHNSMSSAADGFIAPNHMLSLEDSLRAGYRALNLDLCDCGDDGLQLCHGFCMAGQLDPNIVLEVIRNFLVENPREILLLELQVEENNLLSDFFDIMTNATLVDLMYEHPGVDVEWPTLGDLVANEKRLIVFQHDGPDCDVEGNCPAGIHNTFSYMFETSWELKGVDEVLNFGSSCTVTRGSVSPNAFFILNHFGGNSNGLPDDDIATAINKQSVLESRIAACEELVGHQVNLIQVDFWNYGNVVEVARIANEELGGGAKAVTQAPSVAPVVSSTSDLTDGPTMNPIQPVSELSKSPSTRPVTNPTDTIPPTLSSPSASPSLSFTASPTTSPTVIRSNVPSRLTTSPSSVPTLYPINGPQTGLPTESRTLTDCGCGSQLCSASVLDQMAADDTGSFSCRDRIIWVIDTQGLTEQQACVLVSDGFPSICGQGCNPNTCLTPPTVAPSNTTSSPTTSPVAPSNTTSAPTTFSPSQQPMEQPTISPVDQQTASPTNIAESSDDLSILTDKQVYNVGESIIVTFENANASDFVWVGIEQFPEENMVLGGDDGNILWWNYACDWVDVCERPVTSATLEISDASNWPLEAGVYVAYLAEDGVPPYDVLASTEFRVLEGPSPTQTPATALPTKLPTIPSPIPTLAPTSSPIDQQTTLPTNLATSSDDPRVSTNQQVYNVGESIIVTFENANVSNFAWVGIEQVTGDDMALGGSVNILWWNYACDWIDVCEPPITNAIIEIRDGDNWPLEAGVYVAYLAEDVVPPYDILAATAFSILAAEGYPSPSPSAEPTPQPTTTTTTPGVFPTIPPTSLPTLAPATAPATNDVACENDIELCNDGKSFVTRDPLNDCQFSECSSIGSAAPSPRCLPSGWKTFTRSECLAYPETFCSDDLDCTEADNLECGYCLPPACATEGNDARCGGVCISMYCCTENATSPATSTWCY